MFEPIYRLGVGFIAKRYAYDVSYLRSLIATAPNLFQRFARAQSLLRATGGAPKEAWHAATIAGALYEDCGPCVQIAIDQALEAGLDPHAIRQLLTGGAPPVDMGLGFAFARALLAQDDLVELRARVCAAWGEGAPAGLAFAAIQARAWPTMKRALGYAKTCERIRLGAEWISPITAKPAA